MQPSIFVRKFIYTVQKFYKFQILISRTLNNKAHLEVVELVDEYLVLIV